MRVGIFNALGQPAGSREIPDDVVAAAHKLRSWLMLQDRKCTLAGVTLSDDTPLANQRYGEPNRIRCLACLRCPDCPERTT